jgi:Flp pilus assembly protein TadD
MVDLSLRERLVQTWQEGLELNRKKEVSPTIERGRRLLVEGDDPKTVEFLEEAIQRFPDDPEIRFLYASVLKYVRPEDVASEAMKAAELDPDDPDLLTRIAYLMSAVSRPELARRYAVSARELGGSDLLFAAELDHLESRFAMEDGDEEAAEKGFRLSVERQPDSEMFAIDLAKFLAERGRRVEAMEVVERALQTAKSKDELTRVGKEFGEKA